MGGGNFDTQKYHQAATTYKKQDRVELFQQKQLSSDFNPLKITVRESCASQEHPDPTAIIIACDVTGSMGKIPENLLKGGLGKIMESLLIIKAISNPQVMFAAVGDTETDKAPLQVTQFESDNRIEAQLKQLYLEGGGGGNHSESYHSMWYFAAYKTQLDSWKVGKKGLLFTMGDEMVPAVLKADHIRKFIDPGYKGTDISTHQLMKDVTDKYEVFHLVVQDTSTYQQIGVEKVNSCWQQYLGERTILVAQHTQIPEKIMATVQSWCELSSDKTLRAKTEGEEVKKQAMPENGLMSQIGLFGHKTPSVSSDASLILNKDQDNIPHLFMCPISQAVMKAPVIAEDGYTYEQKNISSWLEQKASSPMTNEIIGKRLIPNHSLKSEIEQWQAKQASSPVYNFS